MTTDKAKDTLFYDGQCPICSAEISRIISAADGSINIVDINSTAKLPLDQKTLFSELHLLKPNGEILVGLEANVAAWQHTKYRGIASILLWPVIRQMAELGYKVWLLWYHRQRKSRIQPPHK